MEMNYPATRRVDHVDVYHGKSIADPYRWLEDDNSEETKAWVSEQNQLTFDYLKKIPFRDELRKRCEELHNYPKLSSPIKKGENYFFYKNNGLQNQPVIYIQKGLAAEPEVFLDPNEYSKEGTTALNLGGFSEDNKHVAIYQSDSGSDWQVLRVMNVETRKFLDDEVKWVKFSGAAWKGNGFYYSRFPEPEDGAELSGDNKNHKIYFHRLGTPQSDDKVVFENADRPKTYHYAYTTEDCNFLIILSYQGTSGGAVSYIDLSGSGKVEGGEVEELFCGYDYIREVIDHRNGRFIVRTNEDAENYRLISVAIDKKDKSSWVNLIPESSDTLTGVTSGGGRLFAHYLKDVTTKIYEFDYDCREKKEIQLPGLGAASGFSGRREDKTLFYSFSSITRPNSVFQYDIESSTTSSFHESELKFNPDDFVEKQIFYKSKDGTRIPMFIVHKKGVELNGSNPTLLYSYGGFNASILPEFNPTRIAFLERGGVFALANIRGGGEYGEAWHKAGMLLKKQNVFDDFIAAGEYLISEKYTDSSRLAVTGRSNGGLLIGAVMTQRPELFAVALPSVGVLDMLRFHKFTVGHAWVGEYGSSDDAKQFENLLKYSPLHNLKDGTKFPATMVMTGDHDDRVVPAHSFKFAAQLQKSHAGNKPVLIRIDVDAGHGMGKPTVKVLDEVADTWAFLFENTRGE